MKGTKLVKAKNRIQAHRKQTLVHHPWLHSWTEQAVEWFHYASQHSSSSNQLKPCDPINTKNKGKYFRKMERYITWGKCLTCHTQRSSHMLLAVGFFFFFSLQVSREDYTPLHLCHHPNCPLDKRPRKASMSHTEKVTTSNDHNSYHDWMPPLCVV